MPSIPAWMRSQKMRAAAPDCVKREAVLPYRLRFVNVIAASRSGARITLTTGPKISSRPTKISGVTFVEDRRPEEAAARPVGDGLAATVEAKPGSFRHPALNRSPDPLFLLWVHHGTERRGVVQTVSQLEFTRRADEGIDDGVLSHSIADHYQHAPGKTALSRRAEARSNQGGQAALQVGIGQDD